MRHLRSLLLLLPALIALGISGRAAAEDPPAAPVVLGEVAQQEIKQGRAFVGRVEAERSVVVEVQTGGHVDALLVEAGDRVEKDDALARLDTKTLEIRIRAARSQLTLRQQELKELQNGSRKEDIDASAARLQEAEAEEENAKWKLEAVTNLRDEGKVSSEEELREARRAYRVAVARRSALRAAHELLVKGPREERIAQAQATVDAQQAEIDRLEDDKEHCEVKAPFAGFVVRKIAEEGAWLETGGQVVELVALDRVDVVVPVLEDFLEHLREGTKVRVVIDALDAPNIEGTIHRIVPMADPRSHTAPVKIRIANEIDGDFVRIKPGMFARVQLAVGAKRNALVAPKDAIVLGGRSPVLMVFDPETSTVKPVPVKLGVAVTGGIEVSGEIGAGTKVVVRGNERVRPGMKVRPIEGTR